MYFFVVALWRSAGSLTWLEFLAVMLVLRIPFPVIQQVGLAAQVVNSWWKADGTGKKSEQWSETALFLWLILAPSHCSLIPEPPAFVLQLLPPDV